MSFLAGLLPFAGPLFAGLGNAIRSTLGDIGPKLVSSLAGSAAQGLAEKIGAPVQPRASAREMVNEAVSQARGQLKRKAQDYVCEDEQKKVRVLENKLKKFEAKERRNNFRQLPQEDFEL